MRNLQKYQQDYEVIFREELLANLYESKGNYQYRHPITGRSIYLGKNPHDAVKLTMQLNVGLAPLDNRVTVALRHSENNYTKSGKTFSQFAHHYQKDILPIKGLSFKTIRDYGYCISRFSKKYGKHDINQISLNDVSDFLNQFSPTQSNNYRSCLSTLWKHAMAEGLVSDNLPAKTLKKRITVKRERLSIDGFKAIRNYAPDWLKNAMDIALLTGQRVGDISKMKHSDIKDGFIYIKQSKTSQALKIPVIGYLSNVIERCSLDCNYLISIQNKSITSEHISKVFSEVRNKIGFYANIESPPTFHEIRSLSAHLQESGGLDKKEIQKWLGHASEKMTDLYLSRRESFKTVSSESMLQLSQLITL